MGHLLNGYVMHLDHNAGHRTVRRSFADNAGERNELNHFDLHFYEPLWADMKRRIGDAGENTLFMNLGNGVQYASYPELAVAGAWTRQRLKREIAELRDKGVTAMPKLNFSMMHCEWLGEYRQMPGTATYYRVCRELISEVARLFKGATHFHIGMDEENVRHFHAGAQLGIFRQNDFLYHDLQFLFDCVRDEGMIPVIWGGMALEKLEEFTQRIAPGELVIMAQNAHAIARENWTPIESEERYKNFYTTRVPWKYMNIQYVEEDPVCACFREGVPKLLDMGYDVLINATDWYGYAPVASETFAHFVKDEKHKTHIAGYMMTPWLRTYPEYHEGWMRSMDRMQAALRECGLDK